MLARPQYTHLKFSPFSDSIASTSSDTSFRMTRQVLRNLRSMRTVSVSEASTILLLKLSGQQHSLVAQNLVPQFTPSAPKANAAAI